MLFAATKISAAPADAGGLRDMLRQYLLDSIRRLDERRRRRLASARSPAAIARLQTEVRANLAEMLGPLPEITALNSSHRGSLQREDYVVEKVVYESRPRFPVTANLYAPRHVEGRLPAVILLPGRVPEGKAHEPYQRFCILLARLGFVALTWDPIGAGERREHSPEGAGSSPTGALGEREVLGRQCYLLGLNLLQYRIWDALRAIDYLQVRPEVDPGRIAVAGHGGAAMETLLLACFDQRLQAAVSLAPGQSLRGRAESLLDPDPERVLFRTFEHGIDYPEMLAGIAPRPLLIGLGDQDPHAEAWTRVDFPHITEIYEASDAAEKLGVAPPAEQAGFTRRQRELAARWLVRWLADSEQTVAEKPAVAAAEQDLRSMGSVPAKGLVTAETVGRLNQAYAEKIAPQRKPPTRQAEYEIYRSEILHKIRRINRVGAPRREAGIFLPDRVFEVGAFARGVAVVVAEAGKDHPGVRRGVIDPLVASGYRVLALDLRGWGETAPLSPDPAIGFSWDDFLAYRALEIGRPLMGQRVKDLLAAAPRRTNRREWLVAGVGAGALVAAQAAVLDPRINAVISIGGLLSFRSLLDDASPKQPLSNFLPGVVGAYDMRDVYAAIAPRKLLVVNPQNPQRAVVDPGDARRELRWTAGIFEILGARSSFSLQSKVPPGKMRGVLTEWLAKS